MKYFRSYLFVLCVFVSALTLVPSASLAEPLIALTTTNTLLTLDTDEPGTVTKTTTITGLQTGENILGIDFRPANGTLYGLGSTSILYTINLTTGAATAVGPAFTPALDGTAFAFDFNPVADRIRVISNNAQNLRLNPDTGAVAGLDTAVAYPGSGDTNSGATPAIVGAAYTNSFSGVASTSLFVIDSGTDDLALQGSVGGSPTSPNTGTLSTVGPLALDFGDEAGLDFSPLSGRLFASLTRTGQTATDLLEIGLGTGLPSTRTGFISSAIITRDIALPILDTTAPTVTITTPSTPTRRIKTGRLLFSGTAADNLQIVAVKFRTVHGNTISDFEDATGTDSWSFRATGLQLGVTTVQVKAIDLYGNESGLASVTVTRLRKNNAVRLRRARAHRR